MKDLDKVIDKAMNSETLEEYMEIVDADDLREYIKASGQTFENIMTAIVELGKAVAQLNGEVEKLDRIVGSMTVK
jgi:uncharacterized protein YoxC